MISILTNKNIEGHSVSQARKINNNINAAQAIEQGWHPTTNKYAGSQIWEKRNFNEEIIGRGLYSPSIDLLAPVNC